MGRSRKGASPPPETIELSINISTYLNGLIESEWRKVGGTKSGYVANQLARIFGIDPRDAAAREDQENPRSPSIRPVSPRGAASEKRAR